jgi:hypothetical protein
MLGPPERTRWQTAAAGGRLLRAGGGATVAPAGGRRRQRWKTSFSIEYIVVFQKMQQSENVSRPSHC